MTKALLSFITLLLFSPVGAQLVNPGFEGEFQTVNAKGVAYPSGAILSGETAKGWNDNSEWANVDVKYAKEDQSPHSGLSCQKITILKGFAQFGQPIPFSAGIMQGSIWMRAEKPMWVSLTLRLQPSPYTSYGSTSVIIGQKWQKVNVQGYVPKATDGILLINTAGTGIIWLDDANFHPAKNQTLRYQAITLTPPTTPVPDTYFGLNVNHMHDSPGFQWPALKFGAYRTWDSGVIWPQINPQRGVFNWDWLDQDVAHAQEHNAKFLFTLGQTPTWAASKSAVPGVYGKGFNMPPVHISDWTDFLKATVTRYKGRIEAYEIWNEPNLPEFYNDTPASLVKLEKAAIPVIHSIDKNALIVCPPVSGGNFLSALGWFDNYLSAGGGRECDVIAYHFYNYPPENDIDAMHSFRGLLQRHGLQRKPIWITENGADLSGDTEQAADLVAREYLLDWALGAQRLYFYAYDNEKYVGLDQYGKPGGEQKLDRAGIAFREVRKWMLGSTMTSCRQDGEGLWICNLKRPNGALAWVIWSISGNKKFAIPASWKVSASNDLSGVKEPIVSKEINVNETPIELE
jgi:hypothetical protein